jgi:fermentation-respiration switch protein FrsA (DUF1100 family)
MAFLIIFIAVSAIYLSQKSLKPKTVDYSESLQKEIEDKRFDNDWFSSLTGEDVYIDSYEGLKLHGIWYGVDGAEKTVILCHGYGYSLYGSVKYMKMFMDRGFNALITDHRYHGLSEGKLCTMGHKEKMDLVKWVNWIEGKVGRDTVIGSHGVSMGASIALLHGAVDDRIRFIVSDCAYQSVFDQLSYRLKQEYKLPAFPLMFVGSLINKIRTGAFYRELSSLEAVKKIKVPVLFIHGNADEYATPSNTINLHKSKNGPGFIYMVPEAKHAEGYNTNPENYKKVLFRFLENAGV